MDSVKVKIMETVSGEEREEAGGGCGLPACRFRYGLLGN